MEEQHFNCTCPNGYHGNKCQSQTTFSLYGDSYIKIPSNRLVIFVRLIIRYFLLSWVFRCVSSIFLFNTYYFCNWSRKCDSCEDGYELQMRFRTTLGNGLLAAGLGGGGLGNSYYSLFLVDGKLNLHSGLIDVFEGIWLGDKLNNTEWQTINVVVTPSHLILGINGKLQAKHQVNQVGENSTTFFHTFIGGTTRTNAFLSKSAANFTGCMEDIVVNGVKITEDHINQATTSTNGIEKHNTAIGCDRQEQCDPNPCKNQGTCRDLWKEKSCQCQRPFLGPECQYSKLHNNIFS